MFLLQQLEKTKKQQLAIGAYCVKFGLTKADLEEVLHIKCIKESQNTYGGKKVPKECHSLKTSMTGEKDIDDWREWNDNRYIDDSGESEEEKEDESNEDE